MAVAAAEGDELAVADKEGSRCAGGVEGRELIDLAGEGVKVERVVGVALVDDGEIAGSGGRNASGSLGDDGPGVCGFDFGSGAAGQVKAIEVDLNAGSLLQLRRGWGVGAKEIGLWFGCGWRALDRLDGEQIGLGREENCGDATVDGDEKWAFRERFSSGQVGHGSEDGEGVADAQEKVAVAKGPQILSMIVHAPCGAGEDTTGGYFEEDGVDVAILIVLRLVWQALEEMAGAEGKEEMLIVDVVQRKHGAAGEQELGGLRLEAKVFEWDSQGWFWATSGMAGDCCEEKKAAQDREASAQHRDGVFGNRHGSGRVSLLTENA
jgi:hypothetical protein